MGTDAGNPFTEHGENLQEIPCMVEAGFTPMEAPSFGTQSAAQLIGMENELGTLEQGKYADLVMVQGNPLEDVNLLVEKQNIQVVMKAGTIVKEIAV